jgi:hypothetical protein
VSLTLKLQLAKPIRFIRAMLSDGYPENRDALGLWLNEEGLRGTMVEVGCYKGDYAKTVLKSWQGAHYIMVDPWIEQSPDIFKEKDSYNHSESHKQCLELARNDPRISLLREFSVEASMLIQDGSLDCCYIDGNHAYIQFLEDMDHWWPKVKVGGIICGHDYYNHTRNGHWCEVKKALDKWAGERSLPFNVTTCSSWWILKP